MAVVATEFRETAMDCAAIKNPKNTVQLKNRVSLFSTATQPIAASYLDRDYRFLGSYTSVAIAEPHEAASDCAAIENPESRAQRIGKRSLLSMFSAPATPYTRLTWPASGV